MINENSQIVECDCCQSVLNKRKFHSKKGILKENFMVIGETVLCFECAGFYLYETHLKNLNHNDIKAIITDIQEIKNPTNNEDEDDGKIMEIN